MINQIITNNYLNSDNFLPSLRPKDEPLLWEYLKKNKIFLDWIKGLSVEEIFFKFQNVKDYEICEFIKSLRENDINNFLSLVTIEKLNEIIGKRESLIEFPILRMSLRRRDFWIFFFNKKKNKKG